VGIEPTRPGTKVSCSFEDWMPFFDYLPYHQE
jgi:hypothetical protein